MREENSLLCTFHALHDLLICFTNCQIFGRGLVSVRSSDAVTVAEVLLHWFHQPDLPPSVHHKGHAANAEGRTTTGTLIKSTGLPNPRNA